MDKTELRKMLKKRRQDYSRSQRAEEEIAVANLLEKLFQDDFFILFPDHPPLKASIASYLPIQNELAPPSPHNHPVFSKVEWSLPVVSADCAPLQFRRWTHQTRFETGAYGIKEPDSAASLLQPDIILLPLLGVDITGNRLGYGGGFYDRTLANLRKSKNISAVGLAFTIQIIQEIPHELTDEKLDFLLTGEGIMQF